MNLIWRYDIDPPRLLLVRFSKINTTTVTTARANKKKTGLTNDTERQIVHCKSRSVLSVRFPFFNWRSCSVAKSAYERGMKCSVKVKHQQESYDL